MGYRQGCYTTCHLRYHIVWAPKYRCNVLHGKVRVRVRDHVHMFVEIPPYVSVSDFFRTANGRLSRKIQEFEHIRKRYWAQRIWGRGCFWARTGKSASDRQWA